MAVVFNDSIRVVLENVNLDGDLLVEANEAVVHDEAVELEFAGTSEALLHLELANIAVDSLKFLNLDHVFFGLGINDNDIPVALLDKGIISGMDITWTVLFIQQIILNVDCERDDVARGNRRFSFNLNFL